MSSLHKSKSVRMLNLYFQVHQPRRLRNLSFFDIGNNGSVFDDALSEGIIRKVAMGCYQPVNLLLLKLIRQYPQLRITFSISGTALEQLEKYCPAVLESFRMLAATESVEFLGETYYHSLCSLTDTNEFAFQVTKHSEAIQRLLGVTPSAFRNTELIYSDQLGRQVQQLGYKGMYLDGIDRILNQRSPNQLYAHSHSDGLKLFLRNHKLSDDIAFRFSNQLWREYPLTASKFVRWLELCPSDDQLINLGMDYETFGEHQNSETGILKFLNDFLKIIAGNKQIKMINPSEAILRVPAAEKISAPVPISWADRERDLSAWLGNEMQQDAFRSVNNLKRDVMDVNNESFLHTWRHLQTSDHFYYMSTKNEDDGNVHQYFSHYSSPYEAFMNYMNALSNLEFKIQRSLILRGLSSQQVGKSIPAMPNILNNLSYTTETINYDTHLK